MTIPRDLAPHRSRPGVSPVLVGREAELSRVRSAVAASPSLVIVDGEAGIGKSRLIRELVASDLGGTRFLIGHCQHLQDPLPLGPVLDAVTHHVDQIDSSGMSPVIGALAPLMPELAHVLPPPPDPLPDQSAARYRIFRATVELLRHLGPAVLVLEDLHWAESGTFDFLAFLAAHQPPDLAVVVTTRTENGPLPVAEAFARAPEGPASSVSLAPLDAAEVGELARHILAEDVPDPTAVALFETTGGVPFVVEEVLRTLLERLPPADIPSRPDALAALSVSTALRDVVRHRLAALDPVPREIVDVAAVVGPSVDPALLTDVTGHDARQVSGALGAAEAAGLLHDQDGKSRFRHVLAQQIVYEAVPAPNRRWLHLRVAQALEQGDDPLAAARIAHHYDRAGQSADFVRYAEIAADQAIRHGNDAAAAVFLLRATEVPDLSIDDRLRLATKLGRAAVDGLAHSDAVPILTRLLTSDGLSSAVRGELRFALGRLRRQHGLALEGYREIERAVDDLHTRPDLHARALATLAAPETVADRTIGHHTARCDEAERVARGTGHPDVELAVRIARASLLLEQGRPDAWPLVEHMRHDDTMRAHPREHARACTNWAQAALHLGHVKRAESLLADGRRVAERAEYLRVTEVNELVAALVDHAAGRWDGLAARAQELARRTSAFGATSLDGRLLHGQMLSAGGSATDAAAQLRALIADCEEVGAVWPLIPARASRARLLLTLDDVDGSVHEASAAVDVARHKGIWVWAAEAAVCLVDALIASGDADGARTVTEELAAGLDAVDAPLAMSALHTCQAAVAHVEGDDVRADALMESARRTLAEAGLPYLEAQATERLGVLRSGAGSDDGPALLERALRAYGTMSAIRDIARVTRAMRRFGVPVPYPWRGGRRAHGHDLSDREREISELAAAGRTNREIAADLFVSPRTVETHVSNALRKLGLRSRDELKTRLAGDDSDPAPGRAEG
ncbi:regulatory LuxR family protein [Haloactinopolyspora alba]|uniref:Regulatory LuxR family protein n=1 Tax=Haloactinopolyspora alba TaxID=648780 RepID=A0A2P8E259_9ACTN|nr:AAA family ATPase [Haloactinopolyspora alba]PSL03556.1 regulatory LuxR family protein [Haloactinopolyspora alba]